MNDHTRSMGKVYIVILNWNNCWNTIECLESIFKLHYPYFQVIVCDNSSNDGSFEIIQDWASGKLNVFVPPNHALRSYSFPPILKPLPVLAFPPEKDLKTCTEYPHLVLIQTGANLGFAGGMNVGIRYALESKDMGFVWILNNDTVVEADALRYLVSRFQEDNGRCGICGSTVFFYDKPSLIQTYGGIHYNSWLGSVKFLCSDEFYNCREKVEQKMDAVYGASMLVSKKFLEEVGIMSEEYFLYFEELDWAMRGKSKNLKCCYAPESIIYHRSGKSTKASDWNPEKKSLLSDFFLLRNRLLFTRKFFPYAIPTVYLSLFVSIANRIRRRQWGRIAMIFLILMGEYRYNRIATKD